MKFFIVLICLFQSSLGAIDRNWWKKATLYQVLLPSFKDSDGDGIGDFNGLNWRLDYLKDLGIDTVMITPHFSTPNLNCAGYDVTDFKQVNHLFGTMNDFDRLVSEMRNKGLKLIIDMVINHSSDQHPWFSNSVKRIDPYTDYYIWKDPKGYDHNGNPIVPNNWQCIMGGSAWKWHPDRRQFYLHQFIEQMPDLNLRNDLVIYEFKKIFEFWSDKGVAGFRLDAAEHFIEDHYFRNEPFSNPSTQELRGRGDQSNIFTQLLSESMDVIHELRTQTDLLTEKSADYERILIPETHSRGRELYQYYGSEKYRIVHFPFNYMLTYSSNYETAHYYRNVIDDYLNCLPEGGIANWDSENQDIPRRAEVFNEEYEYILTSMVLLLPGVAVIYYGQELGLTGWHFPGRNVDSFRLPMQWDDSTSAGFSTNSEPYLPVSENYRDVNVQKQKYDENSHYNKVRKMISWRKTDAFKYGSFKSYVLSTWVYSFTRRLNNEIYLVIFNLGKTDTEYIDLKHFIENLPDQMVIKLASRNSDYNTNNEINTNQKFKVKPQVAVVLYPKWI
ncbi:alpha-glucosidase-like [Planococcus citri]|uniref:alpha-glucosidase-like n=1 Tax=Planococcus citri TaxID=170843 RepID=UPI0031F8B9B2